jgi:hypothetical protein
VNDVVNHQHLIDMGAEEDGEGHMVGMGEIGVARGGAREGQQEAVGEPLVLALGAAVDAPFERFDPGDLGLQPGEGALDRADLVRRGFPA